MSKVGVIYMNHLFTIDRIIEIDWNSFLSQAANVGVSLYQRFGPTLFGSKDTGSQPSVPKDDESTTFGYETEKMDYTDPK